MKPCLNSLFLIVYACFLCLSVFRLGGYSSAPVDDYAVVIDAGSTGTRCFVFHVTIDSDDVRNVTSSQCGRLSPGVSSFVNKTSELPQYMAPLLLNAAKIIPTRFQIKTSVYIKGTAGMRLLPNETQSAIWKSLVKGLNKRIDVPFLIKRQNVGTIDGRKEAFFAVLASNYIAKSIDGNLHPVEGRPMIGALDMGGSSTQLIFYNGTNDARKVHADDFWSHSWLNYGVIRVHQRVYDYLYHNHLDHSSCDSYFQETEACDIFLIPNPCGFKGYRHYYKDNVVFEGTGEGEKCFHIIERVIWPKLSATDEEVACLRGRPCHIDEIEHPSVHGHHFYAMSAYYFALDLLRDFGPIPLTHWPTPSLEELEISAMKFCETEWEPLLEEFRRRPNVWTFESQLPDRCFESLYIITILERGFAFDRFSRSITYALEIEGSEVEWTLGFALAEIDFRPHNDKAVLNPDKMSFKWKAYRDMKRFFAPIFSFLNALGTVRMKIKNKVVDWIGSFKLMVRAAYKMTDAIDAYV